MIQARTAVALATLSLAAALLAGCVPLLIGTAVVGTAAVATDRRSTGAQLDDEVIEDKTSLALLERYKGSDVHINVTSYNGIVLLTGEVPTDAVKADVVAMVRGTPKVRAVQDELVVGPVTSIGRRSDDSLVTSKVKARYVEANKFQINVVKVVTENGVVYLMGMVTHEEADTAVELARTTNGAQRVVKVFEYVNT
jgi:osmotically-inducible protein OsmY